MHAHDGAEREESRSEPRRVPAAEGATARGPEAVLALQRSLGNEATSRLIESARGAGRPVQRSSVDEVLDSSGHTLPSEVRAEVRDHTGVDLTGVRVHTDAAAARSAQEIGARAYTSGKHMVFTPDALDWHTLFHEAKHVEQQSKGPVAGTDRGDGLRISHASDPYEREAEATAVEGSLAQGAVQTAPALGGAAHADHRQGTTGPSAAAHDSEEVEVPGAGRA